MNMRSTKRWRWSAIGSLFIVIMLASTLTSCSSRAMRTNPFASGSGTLDPDRKNILPLASFNGDETTILWPLMDFDSRGFAIRPLVTVDEDDTSILWPLSGWNSKEGSGWLLTSYWDEDSFGVFPITHVEDDWGFFLTSYWDEDAFGIFPITHLGESANYFLLSYWHEDAFGVFPLMYSHDDWGYALTSYWADDVFGIFPLMHFGDSGGYFLTGYWGGGGWGLFPISYTRYDGSAGYAGPVYWGDDLFGLFPLFSLNDTFSYMGPAWWTDDSGGLFPLYHFTTKGDHLEHRLLFALGSMENGKDYHRSWLFPLWYLEKDDTSHTFLSPLGGSYTTTHGGGHWLFPIWWHDVDGRNTTDLTPLFYSRRSPESSTFVSPLITSQTSEDKSWTWAFPTWYSRTTAEASCKTLLPLWYSGESRGEKTSWMAPFYLQHKDEKNYSLYTLLGNYNTSPGESTLNVYPLWWSSTDNLATTKMLFPFYHYRNNSGLKSLITPLGGYGWDDQGTTRFKNILGPLYHHHQTQDKTFELTGLAWPLYTRWRQDDTTREVVPLLYHRKSSPGTEHISLLSYLCQIQLETDSTSWMMFPFVSASDRKTLPNALWWLNLFHFYDNGDKQVTRLTPFYQRTQEGDHKSSYLFPLYHESETPDEYDLDALVFLGDYNKTAAGSSFRAWPLASVSHQPKRPDPLYYLSLFSYHSYADKTNWWATPLVGHYSDENDSLNWALPATWWIRNGRGDLHIRYLMGLGHVSYEDHKFAGSGLFPLYGHSVNDRETDLDMLFFLGDYNSTQAGTSFRAWPLFSVSGQPRRPDPLYYLSLFSYHSYKDEMSWWASPLIGHAADGSESISWVLPFTWWTRDGRGELDIRYLLGLGDLKYQNGKFAENSLFPLYSITNSRRASGPGFYLIDWASHDHGYRFGLFPLLGLEATRGTGRHTTSLSILGGLGGGFDSWSTGKARGSKYSYLILGGGRSEHFVQGEVPSTPAAKTVSSSSSYFFPIYHKGAQVKRRWKPEVLTEGEMTVLAQWWVEVHAKSTSKISNDDVVTLLTDKGYSVRDNTTPHLKKVVSQFAKKGCFDLKESSFTSLIYWSRNNAKRKHWNFLFWLAHYNLDRTKNHSKFRVLKFIYASEQEGPTVRRSFFPFCTYDTSGEASDFSFLWRIWRRTKDKNGNTSGYFFFFPWGGSD